MSIPKDYCTKNFDLAAHTSSENKTSENALERKDFTVKWACRGEFL